MITNYHAEYRANSPVKTEKTRKLSEKSYFVLKVKFSGKDPGNAHHIPSVSNSSGLPIFSTNKRAF